MAEQSQSQSANKTQIPYPLQLDVFFQFAGRT